MFNIIITGYLLSSSGSTDLFHLACCQIIANLNLKLLIGSCNLAFVKSLDILDMLSNFYSQNVCRLKKFEKHFSIAMLTLICFGDRERGTLDNDFFIVHYH